MQVHCPNCIFQGAVNPSKIPPQGARVKCPQCGEPFVIQRPANAPPAGTAAEQPVPAAPVPQTVAPPGGPGRFGGDPAPPVSPGAAASEQAPEGLSLAGPPLDREPPPPGDTGLSLKAPPPAAPAAQPPAPAPSFSEPSPGPGIRTMDRSDPASPNRPSTAVSGTGRRSRGYEKGGLMPRLAARLLDGAVFLLFFFLVVKPIYFKMSFDAFEKFAASPEVTQFLNSQDPTLPDMSELGGSMVSAVAVAQSLIWGFLLIYNVFFLGRYGATPGKMMVGLRVKGPADEDLGYFRAFGRFLADFVLVPFTLGIGYLLALFNQDGKGLHDLVAGTRVVQG